MGGREKEYDPMRTLRRMRNTVVAVLLAVLAWLLLSRAYAATRADNALDELYYSTLDCGSEEAFLHGHYSPTVLASALSAYRDDRPRICIAGVRWPYWVLGRNESAQYINSFLYLFGYEDGRVTAVDGVESLMWYIEDGSEAGQRDATAGVGRYMWTGDTREGNDTSPSPDLGRNIVILVNLSPESIGGSPSNDDDFSGAYNATWVYSADSKTLLLDEMLGPQGDVLNGEGAYSRKDRRYDERVFALNGADPMLMADLSRQAIRDVVLRGYLEGAGLSDGEVESRLSEVDPIIDGGVDQAKEIYRCYQGVHADG